MPMVLWTSFLAFICTYVSDLQFLVYVQCGPHLLAHNYVGFATLDLGLLLAWFAPSPFKVYTYRGPRLFWSLLFCVSSGLRYPTLIMFLINTSLSMPTTDADGALDFVSGFWPSSALTLQICNFWSMCTAVNTYCARLCGLSPSFVS